MPAVLFDMDGTLVDSEPLWGIATYEMSERLGRRLTPELRERTIGGTWDNTYRICAEWAGIDIDEAQKAEQFTIMQQRMRQLLSQELETLPGIRPLLGQLHERGVPMMIVTNTARAIAEPAFEAIGLHYFVGTVCGDDVERGKPDPMIYQTAAAFVGVAPENCLAVEDSATGMAAAAAAGCRVLGLPADAHTEVPAGVRTLAEFNGGDMSFAHVDADRFTAIYQQLTPLPQQG